MAEAIARGLIAAGVDRTHLLASDLDESRCEFFSSELEIPACTDNYAVAEAADIIIIAIKPHIVQQVLGQIGECFKADQILISIAAGITIDSIQSKLPDGIPVIRAMPNTPALIGQGATAIAPGKYASTEEMDVAAEVFGAVGKVVRVTEDKLNAVTGLSGSGPAYVYTFIEALADGGVRMGLPKSVALTLAAQTLVGAAEMVLETHEHPAVLRDRVMTPGGTTIAGMAALERSAFRSAVMEAVTDSAERAAEMSKPNKS